MANQSSWYLAEGSNSIGPMSLGQLVERLKTGNGSNTPVFGPGLSKWTPAKNVPSLAMALVSSNAGTHPPPPPMRQADEIDYEIFGEEMQYVEITLDPNETVIAEAGTMMYMTSGIKMETVFGDPSSQQASGFWGKVVTAGKRAMTGESLFMTTFTAQSAQREQVAFAAPYPGKVIPVHLDKYDGELICQKDAFLCAAKGVQIGIAFQKRIGAGLFGGEGFIMQRLTGDGIALIHSGGTTMHRTLEAGETLRLDTGCLVALTRSVDYDVQLVGGIKNTLFGGEGLFLAILTGPGEIWCQSLPLSRLAGRLIAAMPSRGGSKGEGSILGGLGNVLDGDNA